MKFKVGDKVVRTEECPDYYTVKQGCEYVISKVDDEYNTIYLEGVYDCNGQPDWFNPDNFELVEAVNDLAKAQKQVDKELTPFEKKGWTENSIFKVVGNSCSHQFDIGSLVVLHEDNGSRQPCFKPQEFHGKEADYDEDCWYMYFHDLWYISEVVEQGTEQQKGVKKLSTLDYTDKSIFKVIDDCGSCFEVGDLVVIDSGHDYYDARFKLLSEYGQYRKPYMNWLVFEGLEYVGELGALEEQVKESKKLEIKAQIESLQEQLKTLD